MVNRGGEPEDIVGTGTCLELIRGGKSIIGPELYNILDNDGAEDSGKYDDSREFMGDEAVVNGFTEFIDDEAVTGVKAAANGDTEFIDDEAVTGVKAAANGDTEFIDDEAVTNGDTEFIDDEAVTGSDIEFIDDEAVTGATELVELVRKYGFTEFVEDEAVTKLGGEELNKLDVVTDVFAMGDEAPTTGDVRYDKDKFDADEADIVPLFMPHILTPRLGRIRRRKHAFEARCPRLVIPFAYAGLSRRSIHVIIGIPRRRRVICCGRHRYTRLPRISVRDR
jgi:hypothetical protein